MIVPSIEIAAGRAVRRTAAGDAGAGDPRPLLERLRVAGEVTVTDHDAARGTGSNADLLRELCRMAPCRVAGGIRDAETAIAWLDAGAERVVLDAAVSPEDLRALPAERVVVALDPVPGDRWRGEAGRALLDRVTALEGLCGGVLVTLDGVGMASEAAPFLREVVAAARGARVTVAGADASAETVAGLDRLGADAQLDVADPDGSLSLADALLAPAASDRPDGLFPTVVCDVRGVAMGLAYSSRESVRQAVETRRGVYHSRKRGPWEKGGTSGATQELLRVDLDCDRDALRFTVRQAGPGFCHHDTWTCWGEDGGLGRLERRLAQRLAAAPEGSYTARLLTEPGLLDAKILEEARELAEAQGADDVTWEAADLLYFALVAVARGGASLAAVEHELDRRARAVSRRPGNAKPA